MADNKNKKSKSMLSTTVLLALVAIIAATAASLAWFTISDTTRIQSLSMDVTAGLALRIDTEAHKNFEDYTQHLTLDFGEKSLLPVTSEDGRIFRLENGTVVETAEGYYAEFELHFMGTMDMYVHLTSTDASDAEDGTRIWSDDNKNLSQAMRLCLDWVDGEYIYNPRTTDLSGWTDENTLFFLPANKDQQAILRIWLEGNDPNCKNDLKNIDFSIKLKFEGTDINNNRLQ